MSKLLKKDISSRRVKIITEVASTLEGKTIEELVDFLIELPYNSVITKDLIEKSKNNSSAQLAIKYGLTIDQIHYITKRKNK